MTRPSTLTTGSCDGKVPVQKASTAPYVSVRVKSVSKTGMPARRATVKVCFRVMPCS